jgi:hypothetical protein
MDNYFYAWQDLPKYQNGFHKDWHVQTNDMDLALDIRRRKESTENRVFGIRMYLFHIQFHDKKTALKSLNTLLKRNKYPKLKENADMGVFMSSSGVHMPTKKKVRSTNE